jgi:HAT1-interacting factor 1
VNTCIYITFDYYELNPVMRSVTAKTEPEAKRTLEEEIELARRAFALKQYEQAVDHYATALELQYVYPCRTLAYWTYISYRTGQFGDHAPENADLYFAYGKALLENAIANSGVLGKTGEGEQDGEDDDDEPG